MDIVALLRRLFRRGATVRPLTIGNHESPVRRMLSEANSTELRVLKSLHEAQATKGGTVILEGDYGGQIYIVCPAEKIRCSDATLRQLGSDLDEIAWPPAGEPAGRGLYYEVHFLGEGIAGGMGGGLVTGDVWIHEEFIAKGLKTAIMEVLSGSRQRLAAKLPD